MEWILFLGAFSIGMSFGVFLYAYFVHMRRWRRAANPAQESANVIVFEDGAISIRANDLRNESSFRGQVDALIHVPTTRDE